MLFDFILGIPSLQLNFKPEHFPGILVLKKSSAIFFFSMNHNTPAYWYYCAALLCNVFSKALILMVWLEFKLTINQCIWAFKTHRKFQMELDTWCKIQIKGNNYFCFLQLLLFDQTTRVHIYYSKHLFIIIII